MFCVDSFIKGTVLNTIQACDRLHIGFAFTCATYLQTYQSTVGELFEIEYSGTKYFRFSLIYILLNYNTPIYYLGN